MSGGVFCYACRQGKNFTEQSFGTQLASTPTRTPGDALMVRYRTLTYAKFGHFYPQFWLMVPSNAWEGT